MLLFQWGKPTKPNIVIQICGKMVLITSFEFTYRASLWSPTYVNTYIPVLKLGSMTEMARLRFENIWSEMRWIYQPTERSDEMSHAEYRWLLIDDMVKIFNTHREYSFIRSELICVDESISRCYGLGSGWINIVLPMYISSDHNLDNGCEI